MKLENMEVKCHICEITTRRGFTKEVNGKFICNSCRGESKDDRKH